MSYGGFTTSNRLNGIFSSSTIDEPVTLVCWIKYSAANWADTAQDYVIALSKDTSLDDMFAIGSTNGTADEVYLIANNAGGAKVVEANTGNTSWTDGDYDDVWVPVVAVFESTTSSTIYIENSTLGVFNATTKDIALGATPQIRIGSAPNNNAATPGQVAEVAIFNKALTPAEIDELQIRPGVGIPPWKVAPDNCVGYWSLKNNKASHAPDYTVDEGTPNLIVEGSPTYFEDHPTILSGNDIFIVDSVSAESGATPDISDSVATLGLALQKDDVIVACISNNDAGNTLDINDNNGGAFIPITNRVQGASYAHRCFFYVVGDTPLTTFAFDMDGYAGRMSRTYIQLRGANTTLPIQSVAVDPASNDTLPNPGRTQYLNTLALAFVTDDNVSTAGDDISGWTNFVELVEANGAAGQMQAAGYRYQPEPGLLKQASVTPSSLVATTVVVNPANLIDVPDSSAVYYVDHSGTANAGPVSSVTHTHGHNIEPGDLILAAINIDQATPASVTTITDNQSGTYPFTQCDNFPVNTNGTAVQSLWWRIAEAGEPTSYQFTHDGTASRMSIGTIVFRGVNPGAPFREFPDGANISYDGTASVFSTICGSAACNPQEMGVALAWLDNGSGGSFGSVDNNFNFHDDTDFAGVNSIAWASRRVATNETGQTTFTSDSSSGRTGLQFSLVPKQISRTGHHFVASATAYDAAGNNVILTPDFDIRKDDVLIAVLHHSNAGAFTNTEGEFTEYFSEENPTTSTSQIAFWQRVCDGTENGSSWEFVSAGGNARFAVHMLQFRGIDTHDIWEVGPSASTRGTVEAGTTLASPVALTTTNPHTIALAVCTTDNAGVNYSGYPGGFENEVGHGTGQGLAEVTQVLTSSGTQTVFNATASEAQNQVYYYVALKAAEQPYRYVRGEDPTPLVVQRTIQGYPTIAASYDVSITGYTPGNIGIIGCVTDDSSASEDFVTPDGWTRVDSGVPTAGSRGLRGLYWKVLGPDEPNPTTLTRTGGTDAATAFFMEVSGGREVAAATTQFVSTGDELAGSIVPPALAAPWGAEDNLWITGVLGMDDQATITTWPVGYEDNQLFDDNGNGPDTNEWIALSHRNASVAYEAPSQFVVSESESIRAFTIVVRPKEHKVYAPAIIGKYAGGYGPRAKRPTGGDQIDWSLPITKDLKLFGSVHEGFPFDYVNRRPGVPQSAWAGVGPSPDGHLGHLGLEADDTTNSILFEKDDEAIGGATEATFMVYTFHSTNVATVNQIVFGYAGTGDDPFYCRMGTTGFQTRIWTDTPNNFTSSVDKSANGLDEAARYLWGATFENNFLTARVDKIKDSAPSATTGAIVNDGGVNANNLWRFGFGFNGGTGGWDGWATFCAYWRRALTDQEWNMMVDDPWHIFQRKRIYIGQPRKRRVVTF